MRHIVLKTNGTFVDGLQKYITAYYAKLERHAGVRYDQVQHKKLVSKMNEQYLKWLSKTEWDNDHCQGLFIAQIQFLTGNKNL